MAPSSAGPTSSAWLQPRIREEGLRRYLNVLADSWWLVLLAVLICTGAATAYVATADRVYKSTANVLVTPVGRDDDVTIGLGLIRDSSDPTRDVSTAASLIETISVATRVREDLGLDKAPNALLRDITAEPFAQSSLVSVTADAGSPAGAAALANAFAQQAVEERTDQLREQLDASIPPLQRQIDALPPEARSDPTQPLVARLSALQALRSVPDPTMRVVTEAVAPDHASSPRTKLSIAAGLFAGLILGLGAAFGLQAIDPRLRREEQLREVFSLPVLARIPREPKRSAGALSPDRLSPATAEAYRTLRATLAASRADEFRSRSVLVTGSSPSEGKSTTAINFAFSLVQAGNRVILIEGDLRRPTIGAALGIRPRVGIGEVLLGQASLEDALVVAPGYGQDLQLLLVDRPEPGAADRLSLPTARQLIADAESIADYVVVDSPPITEISDALPLAQQVTDVLIVTRMGHSRLGKLAELGEMLAQHGVRPAGVALVGVDRPTRDAYYYAEEAMVVDEQQPGATAER